MKESTNSKPIGIDKSQETYFSKIGNLDSIERLVNLTAKGSGTIFLGKMFFYGSRLLASVIIARALGSENYGFYNLTLTTVTIASSLSILGLDSGVIRYISMFSRRKDRSRIMGTLQIGLIIPILISILLGILVFQFADQIALRIFHEPGLEPLIKFTSFLIPFLTLNSLLHSSLIGFNQISWATLTNSFIRPGFRLSMLAVLAIVGLNVKLALSAFGIALIVTTVILFVFLNRVFQVISFADRIKREYKQILNFSFPVYLSNTIKTFSTNIQTLLIGSLDSMVNVGIFTVADQVNLVGRFFHSSLVTAALPIISALYDQDDMNRLKKYFQTTSRWTFTLNLPLFFIILIYPSAILSLFGESFTGGVAAISILAWANLIYTGTGICGAILDMTGYTKLKLFNSLVSVFGTILLNLLLIPRLGLVGAAVASFASIAIINFLRMGEVYVIFKMLPYNREYLKPLLGGIITIGISLLFSRVLGSLPETTAIILTISSMLIVYVGVIWLLGLSEEDQFILDKLINRVSFKSKSGKNG